MPNSHSRSCRWACLWLIGGLLFASVVPTLRAEATLTVEEFKGLQSKWTSLEGTTFQIEGRYSFWSPGQIRLEKCEMEFILARAFPRPTGESKNLLVAGRIEKRDAKMVFVVSDMQSQPSDLDHFRNLRAKVDSSKPEAWYKLADWGTARAKFYNDNSLKELAIAAFKSGVEAEARNIPERTSSALRKLAGKLASWKADPRLELQYLHEALWIDFRASQKDNRGGEGEILTLVGKQLEGANVPLTPEDKSIREMYLKSPIEEFALADDAHRKKMARIFYVEVMHTRIIRDASPDGKNGYQIADRLEKEVPEYVSEVPVYRKKELDYHLSRAGMLTRKELSEVLSKFDPLEVPEFCDTLKRQWLIARESQLNPKNMTELTELGDEFLRLAGDKEAAIRLYKKAYEVAPESKYVSELLTDQGLTLHKGVWVLKSEIPPAPADPLADAIKNGEVKPGMDLDQVKSALGVEPTRKTRVVTGANLQEWWLYEDHGLSIQFTRRRRTDALQVTKVSNLRASSSPTSPKKLALPPH